ncbi:MAG: hypothetical protein P0S96_04955 [Simkaniaceae bacterium]|nr:hypothetical protein [Candidatus Sacchlamyda saccharinae]
MEVENKVYVINSFGVRMATHEELKAPDMLLCVKDIFNARGEKIQIKVLEKRVTHTPGVLDFLRDLIGGVGERTIHTADDHQNEL